MKKRLLFKINYKAARLLEANKISNLMVKNLAKLAKIVEIIPPERYWKISEQFQVLYVFNAETLRSNFNDFQKFLSSEWYVLNNCESIWNKSSDKNQIPLLHNSVVWAHLDLDDLSIC